MQKHPTKPRRRLPIQERFFRHVKKTPTCWLWTGSTISGGYGQFRPHKEKYKTAYAHRLAWEFVNGTIPKGLYVCHKCDTPACVLVDHLFLGTNQENVNDCVSKNRHAKGFKLPHTKLSENDVLEIRKLYASGKFLQREIADKFGICFQHVSDLVRMRRRNH